MRNTAQPQRSITRQRSRSASLCLIAAISVALAGLFQQPALAQSYIVLHSFLGGADGASPHAGLVIDRSRNLYGTTSAGGANGNGTVFKIKSFYEYNPYSVLYSFAGQPDGQDPEGKLALDAFGNLYGTTNVGGAYGMGTIFKLDKTRTATVLHSFDGADDGMYPLAGVTLDRFGNLYGTTSEGGTFDKGVVFSVDASGVLTVLHHFSGVPDGANPVAAVTRNPYGDLVGTTRYGGDTDNGTVFKVDAAGVEGVLHSFTNGADGANPSVRLQPESGYFSEKVYGTTDAGGAFGDGTLFMILTTTGKLTVMHDFELGVDGTHASALAHDASGTTPNNIGTTQSGGTFGFGTVYKLDNKGVETVIYNFTGGDDGGNPLSDLVLVITGNNYYHPTYHLFGTTSTGGTAGLGTVFELVLTI